MYQRSRGAAASTNVAEKPRYKSTDQELREAHF
jgi:hypothetical protein